MKKLLFLICLLIPITTLALEYPSVNSKVVEIYDLNDKKVLYEVNSNEVVSIASLTKIATTITAIESIENLDEEVIITNDILRTVSWEASKAGLRAGDKLTYRDLLYASILPSGADATHALAILTSGDIGSFVNKMNDLASRIGLEHTHFVNVTGLDDKDHYSTADDVRKLLEYSLANPTFKEIFTTKMYEMTNGKLVKSTLYKYDATDEVLEKITGSKTGFTQNAGYCLSSLTTINGHEMIILVLNAQIGGPVFNNVVDTMTLINFLNNNYKDEVLLEKDKLIKIIPVKLSKINNYIVYSDKELIKFLPSDYDIKKLTIEYDGLEELSYKNKKGDKIGTVSYSYDNELLYKQDVILDTQIEISYKKVIKKYYLVIIGLVVFILIILLLFIVRFIKKKKKRNKKRK